MALLLTFFGAIRTFWPRKRPIQQSIALHAYLDLDAVEGDKIFHPGGGGWGPAGTPVFVITASSTCAACTESRPFDEEVYEYATKRKMPVYYLLSSKPENRSRKEELLAGGRSVLIIGSLQELGFARVPTIARLDASGIVLSKWTGTVPIGEHDAVFRAITSGSGVQSYHKVSVEEMRRLVTERHAQVLAFSGLSTEPGIVPKIIPASEVYVRAKRELDPSVATVVDCRSILSAFTCQEAAMNLSIAHFRDVSVAGLPERSSVCTDK